MDNTTYLRRELAAAEHELAVIAEAKRLAEGERDRLVLALSDADGAHDQRPTGVR